jgi:hypothetical protein
MNFDKMEEIVFDRSKLRRFGLYLGLAIALYISAAMLFIIAY